MSAARGETVIVGGPPRAELLPPEVGQSVKARATRRLLVFAVVVVTGLVAAGVVGATIVSATSAVALTAATDEGNRLLQAQGEYAEVRRVASMIAKAEEGLVIGSATEIPWKDYFAEIQGSLPAGVLVTNFSATTATPTVPYSLPTAPLQGERIGELTFTAFSPTLPDVEAWLNGLEKVKGFVDASPGTVVLTSEGGYTVSIVMHINGEVYENPFVDDEDDTEADSDADAGDDAAKED